jgi:hypothetical protein
MLEECLILLSLQETDRKVREANLAEVQVCVLHSFHEWDLLAELEELRARVGEVEDERSVAASELSRLVMEISNALVDLGMLPMRDIPQLLKTAQEVLAVASLILECL